MTDAQRLERRRRLARQRKERWARAFRRGNKYIEFFHNRTQNYNDAAEWLAHHCGQLTQRVDELEARVARMEGQK